MSLFSPKTTSSGLVTIIFERESLEDDWYVDDIKVEFETESKDHERRIYDWVFEAANNSDSEMFFDKEEVEGALIVSVFGSLIGWWSDTQDGCAYDEEFEREELKIIVKENYETHL